LCVSEKLKMQISKFLFMNKTSQSNLKIIFSVVLLVLLTVGLSYFISNKFVILLSLSIFSFYKSYISSIRSKVSAMEFKRKRFQIVLLIFLVTWGILLVLQAANDSISFSDNSWAKPILTSFGISMILALIPVASAEYSLIRELNKRNS